MTVLTSDNYLTQSLKQRANAQSSYLDEAISLRTDRAPIRAAHLTDEQIADFRSRFSEVTEGMTRLEAAELAAFHANNPGGILRAPIPETFGQSTLRAPLRLVGGVRRGLIIDPAVNLSNAFAALADVAGNPELAEGLRRGGRSTLKQDIATPLGRAGDEPGFFAGAGRLIGNIAPSAVSLFVSGGASFPLLAYYGIQAVGGGAEDYRETMLARGVKPDAIDALAVGVGYGSIEVIAEKLGLNLIGKKIGPKIARTLGDKILRGQKREAAKVLVNVGLISSIEGAEEAITQLTQNSIAANGLYFVEGFDPERPLGEGVKQSFLLGAAGGGLLTFPAVFSPRGRAALRGERTPSPIEPADIDQDTRDAITLMSTEQRQETVDLLQKAVADGVDTETGDRLTDQQRATAQVMLAELEAVQEPEGEGTIEVRPRHIGEKTRKKAAERGIAESQLEQAEAEIQSKVGINPVAITETKTEADGTVVVLQTEGTEAGLERTDVLDATDGITDRARGQLDNLTDAQLDHAIEVAEEAEEDTISVVTGGSVAVGRDRLGNVRHTATNVTLEDAREYRDSRGEPRRDPERIEPPVETGLIAKLDEFEQAARKRMEERGRPAAAARAAGFPGARGASAPLFGDIADTSIIIAVRSLKLGIRGTKAITDAVTAFVNEQAQHLQPHIEAIVRNVRRIISSSRDKDGNVDGSLLEQAAADLRGQASQRDARAIGTVKQQIRQAVFGPTIEPTVTEREALRASLRGQQRVSRQADVAARRQAAVETLEKLKELRVKAQQKTQAVEALRDELVQVVKTELPQRERGKLLTQVRDVKTTASLARGIRRVREVLAESERKEAIAELRKTLKRLDVKKLRPQYRAAVQEVIGPLALKGMQESTKRKLEGLAKFLADERSDSQIPTSVIAEVARLSQTPIDKLTTEQATDIDNAINHFLKLNQLFNRLVRQGRLREQQQIVDQMSLEISTAFTERPRDITGAIQPQKRLNIFQLPFSIVGNLKPDLMSEYMSGGENTVTHQVLYEDLDAGQTEWLRGHQAAMDALSEAIQGAGLELGSRELASFSRIFAREHGLLRAMAARDLKVRHQTKADTETIELSGGRSITLTKGERMHLLASFMDTDTLELILFSDAPVTLVSGPRGANVKLTAEDVATIQRSATAEELAILESSMAYINGPLKDAIREWSVDRLGFDITKVETYFPRHRVRAREDESITSAGFIQQSIRSASIVQERVGGNLPIEIRDFFAEYNNLAWVTFAIKEMDPPFTAARRVLNSPAVSAAILNSKGILASSGAPLRNYWQNMLDELARTAANGPTLRGPVSSATSRQIDLLTRGLLASNPRVMMYQPVSLILATTEVNTIHVVGATAAGAFLDSRIDKRIAVGSPYLRARLESSALGLINEAGGPGKQRILGFSPKGELFMRGIHFFDRMAIRTIWRAAELQATSEGLEGDAHTERTAAVADRAVKRTQPVFDTLHLSGIGVEARRSPTIKAITMFHSQRSQNINMLVRASIRAARDPSPANLARQGHTIGMLGLSSLGIRAVKELWDWILRGFLPPDDDDDESALERWGAGLIEIVAGNFYFGEFIAFPINRFAFPDVRTFDPDLTPIVGNVTDVLNGLVKASRNFNVRDPEFWDGVERLAVAMSALSGLPFTAPYRMARRLFKNLRDEEQSGPVKPKRK